MSTLAADLSREARNSAKPRLSNVPSRTSPSIAEVKARVDIVELISRTVALKRNGRAHLGFCPFHDDSTPSFQVDGEWQNYRCWGCGAHGDAVDFLVTLERLGKGAAIRRLRELASGGAELRPAPTKPQRRVFSRPDTAFEVFRSAALILPGTVAAEYLTARSCALPHPDGNLRFLAQHKCPGGWFGPCLLALVTDAVTGGPMTVHRTWIQVDGSKAPIEKPRLLWHGLPKSGGVIRLWPDEAVTLGLCVAEGIETALTAAIAFGSAWATIDAGNMASLPVLAGIECLTIMADNDPTGRSAAERCRARWEAEGIAVRQWLADAESADFNDYARAVA